MIRLVGDSKLGMRLKDLREFVSLTQDLSGETFIDCSIPDGDQDTELAPLMALECGEDQ